MPSKFGNQIDYGANISGQDEEVYIFLIPTFFNINYIFPATARPGAIVRIVPQNSEYGSFSPQNVNIPAGLTLGGNNGGVYLKTFCVHTFVFNASTSRWDYSMRDLQTGQGYGPVNI